jgi:hypothetical protein
MAGRDKPHDDIHQGTSKDGVSDVHMHKDCDHCAFCGEKFPDGITVWRLVEGWVHPECARKRGRSLK